MVSLVGETLALLRYTPSFGDLSHTFKHPWVFFPLKGRSNGVGRDQGSPVDKPCACAANRHCVPGVGRDHRDLWRG